MSSTTSGSPSPMESAESSAPQRPKILEALGFRVTALTRVVVKKARKLPVVGKSIGYMEDTFSPCLSRVEKDGLCLLSHVDSKIHAVSDIAIAYVPFAEYLIPQFQAILSGQPIDTALVILDRLRTRGVVGSTADIWVDCEPIVKSESHKLYSFVIRVPGVHGAVSILNDISSPLVLYAAEWLQTHTEFKDKHEISLQTEVSPSYPDSLGTPLKTPSHDERDFNALAAESDSDEERSDGPSTTEPVESTEVAQKSEGEMDIRAINDNESTSTHNEGKLPELAVVHEDEEEQDELADLFDTWGMGVKAISPRGLNSLRSLSLKEDSGAKKPTTNPFTSKSFRF